MSSDPNHGPKLVPPAPDPEVASTPRRRRFTAKYKLEILRELDACTQPGQSGAILRREGLYSSHISEWRKKRAAGELQALSPKKTGRPKTSVSEATAKELEALRREKARLEDELRKARTIIEVQKKLSETLANLGTSDSSE